MLYEYTENSLSGNQNMSKTQKYSCNDIINLTLRIFHRKSFCTRVRIVDIYIPHGAEITQYQHRYDDKICIVSALYLITNTRKISRYKNNT